METLVWLVGVAAVLVVVHVLVATYLYRTATTAEESTHSGETQQFDSMTERPEPRAKSGSEHVSCPTCGTPNEPGYRFCRRCVSDMTNSAARTGGPDTTERLGS